MQMSVRAKRRTNHLAPLRQGHHVSLQCKAEAREGYALCKTQDDKDQKMKKREEGGAHTPPPKGGDARRRCTAESTRPATPRRQLRDTAQLTTTAETMPLVWPFGGVAGWCGRRRRWWELKM
ncbi:hypothetical protein BaRGS_00014268 [Batillaria attramentaria]|uniref:Uncharacterized protein n=1 Tax=Batillaria attramentaria TaxID=370345 RepID=A0ABD0L558_9CAEN